jgi:outer membrane protein
MHFTRSLCARHPRCRAADVRRALPFALTTLGIATLIACNPPTPHIDGVPGAPPDPSTPWTVPAAARTPPPPAALPTAPDVTAALRADSAANRTTTLSLTDVVDLALRNNPATRESWALARAAADLYGSARGALFPTINGNVSLSQSTSSAAGGGGAGNTGTGTGSGTGGADTLQTGGRNGSSNTLGGSGTRSQITPSISLSYLVLDFGGRAGTIEAAKQRAIASDLAHNATIQDVVLQAESSVFSYEATRALRDAQITAVTEAQADTAAAEARMRVGVGTLEEVLQTRTALAQERLQLATLEGDLLSARGSVAAAMGFPANARFDIPHIGATDSVRAVIASVDTLINRAITQRPELAEARANAEALAQEVRVARSAGYPALTLSSSASYVRPLQGTSTTASRNSSLVLGLQIPIFNGFSRQYDLRSAREQYEAGLARTAETSLQLTTQVFASYAAAQTATQRVAAARDLLVSAQQSADVALGRYREGVGTIVDLLLARSALATARASEIQGRWEWQTAMAQLAHDVGSLDRRALVTPATPPR